MIDDGNRLSRPAPVGSGYRSVEVEIFRPIGRAGQISHFNGLKFFFYSSRFSWNPTVKSFAFYKQWILGI